MGKEIVDGCVNCGLPCLGDACPKMNVVQFRCDDCKELCDPDELYMYEDEMLCDECLIKRFPTAKQEGFDYDME